MRYALLVVVSMLLGLVVSPGRHTEGRHTEGRHVGRPLRVGEEGSFTFVVTADMREFAGPGLYDSLHFFRGAMEAAAVRGAGAFMLSPGDIDPPWGVTWTITQTLGSDYTWYPVVGNHEAETAADMDWLRLYDYDAVQPGPAGCPETTYSFDYGNSHFVVLNQYCDTSGDTVTDGDIPDHLYDWLAADLQSTSAANVIVVGHEPGYPQPDADNGRLRHENDSLNAHLEDRDRFWELMRQHRVAAYICGHTHNYSLTRIEGVWQLDAGHARGLGDTGAPSTFVLVQVDGTTVSYQTYRDDANGGAYTLMHAGILYDKYVYLPFTVR